MGPGKAAAGGNHSPQAELLPSSPARQCPALTVSRSLQTAGVSAGTCDGFEIFQLKGNPPHAFCPVP